MQPMTIGGILRVLLLCAGLAVFAGCSQLSGIHVVPDTPDPVIGQWIGGEPPETDLHAIFYANHTFLSVNFDIQGGTVVEAGTWTRIGAGSYTTLSPAGMITNWTYDPVEDSIYIRSVPQRKYYRYKG